MPARRDRALKRVGDQLGINPHTLRNWVQQAEVHEAHRPGVTSADAKRIAELEREVKELRRANEILPGVARQRNARVQEAVPV